MCIRDRIFLSEEGADPTVLIGAALPAIGAAYRIGSDDNFIFEACEYKDSFLSFYPRIAVVLNVRLDHTDYFASLEQLKRSFAHFMNNAGASGVALVNADAPDAVEAAQDVLPQVRYFSVKDPTADFFAGNITYDGGFASFDIYCYGVLLCRASLSVIGSFNVSNALAAAACAHLSGISAKAIARGLSEFRGVARRDVYKRQDHDRVNTAGDLIIQNRTKGLIINRIVSERCNNRRRRTAENRFLFHSCSLPPNRRSGHSGCLFS